MCECPDAVAENAQRRSRIAVDLYGAELRQRLIAERAYRLAERRGFAPGHELEDWLAAEAQVDTGLTLGELTL